MRVRVRFDSAAQNSLNPEFLIKRSEMAVIIPSLNAIFLLSPGTGSTSLSTWFLENMGAEWILDPIAYKHATPQDIKMAGLDLSKFTLMTTTRHPLDFYISQYHKKSTWPGDSPEFLLAKNNSFKGFLRAFLESTPAGFLHPVFLNPARVVFRKECLERDLNELLRALGLEGNAQLPAINVSENLSHRFSDWYDAESTAWVVAKHASHFERFRYSVNKTEPTSGMEIDDAVIKNLRDFSGALRNDPMVLPGRNGWLYLSNQSNQVVDCTVGRFSHRTAWIDAWSREIARRERIARAVAAENATYVVPNTHSAVPNNLPRGAKLSKTRPICQLVENVPGVRYPIDELSSEDCFLKNDSHYSEYGAYILYKKICRDLVLPAIQLGDADFSPVEALGDLGSKVIPFQRCNQKRLTEHAARHPPLGRAKRIFYSGVEVTGKFEVYRNDEALSSAFALVIGDSYCYSLIRFLGATFSTLAFCHASRVPANLVNDLRPTHVLYVHAERFMSQFPAHGLDAHVEDYRAKLLSLYQAGMHVSPPSYELQFLQDIPWLLSQVEIHERIYDMQFPRDSLNVVKIQRLYQSLLGRNAPAQAIIRRLRANTTERDLLVEIIESSEFRERIAAVEP